MPKPPAAICIAAVCAYCCGMQPAHSAFTFAEPVKPGIVASAAAYGAGGYEAGRLIDGDEETEFATENQGTNTFVQFRFSEPARIAAFRHLDRADRAVVGESELILTDATGKEVKRFPIKHTAAPGGETFFIFPEPVLASGARWQVTKLGGGGIGTVGGAEINFYSAELREDAPSHDSITARPLPFVQKNGMQPVRVIIDHPYLEPDQAECRIGTLATRQVRLKHGRNALTMEIPASGKERELTATLDAGPGTAKQSDFSQKDVRPLTIFILPHSHTDIGYTARQAAVADKQVNNLEQGMELAEKTANYPEGARFVWNVEASWAADLYLRRFPRNAGKLSGAIRRGQVDLSGLYLNELTALCRPEELMEAFRYSRGLAQRLGVPIRSAMISDVPGLTWGTVSAMAQADVSYLSPGPNYGERSFMRAWENKPFYWIGPDRKSKVLVWIPFRGYALSHIYGKLGERLVDDLCSRLQSPKYPFDLAYIRWAGRGDNGTPDPALCDEVKDWNENHASPRFIISTTTAAFEQLETHYGGELPEYAGDWTPYWEDGAASSALETAVNRRASDRLSQAEALFSMLSSKVFPTDAFDAAWKNVLLYSEHTWGAQESIRHPDSAETISQWDAKRSYAIQADQQSKDLLRKAIETSSTGPLAENHITVFNTLSCDRDGLVSVSPGNSTAGNRVLDADGRAIPSQRLTGGRLVFWAENVPALGGAAFQIVSGQNGMPSRSITSSGNRLDNGVITVTLDPRTGGISGLRRAGIARDYARVESPLNNYSYARGDDPGHVFTNGKAIITRKEEGPLVSSLVASSDAPGCRKLEREVELVAGEDWVRIEDRVDKLRLDVAAYAPMAGKEMVEFGFPFNIPDATVQVDIPLAAMRPGFDQLNPSCDHWYTAGRWVNFQGADCGISWVTCDAPIIDFDEPGWLFRNWKTNAPAPRATAERFHSWVMNNRWGTNYRAYQEGPANFEYILHPHRDQNPADETRMAMAFTHPFVISTNEPPDGALESLFTLSTTDVIVTKLKPSEDGKALIVSLFGASGRDSEVTVNWKRFKPSKVERSGTDEIAGQPAENPLGVPGWGVVTLRAEF